MAPCNSSVSSPPLGLTAITAAIAGGATPPPPYPAYEKSMAVCASAIAPTKSSIAATKMDAPEARRAKQNSPGREPCVRLVNWRAPERGETSTRLQLFRPVPGLAFLLHRAQCSRTGL